MNKIVLIVGPSGVGKTTAVQAVKPMFPDWVFDDLDDLAARWAQRKGIVPQPDVHLLYRILSNAERFLEVGLDAIADLAARAENRPLVIDVGAGFQVAAGATNLHKRYPCITITARPEIAYKRIREERKDARTPQGYISEEFNPHRTSVYDASQHQIDTTNLTIEETTQRLADILRQVVGPSAGTRQLGG